MRSLAAGCTYVWEGTAACHNSNRTIWNSNFVRHFAEVFCEQTLLDDYSAGNAADCSAGNAAALRVGAVIFVGDRGWRQSRTWLCCGNGTGLPRWPQTAAQRAGQSPCTGWQECPVGISAREKEKVPRTMLTKVAGEETGERVFVVQSEERLAYERAMREEP